MNQNLKSVSRKLQRWGIGASLAVACAFSSSVQADTIYARNTGWINQSFANASGFNGGINNTYAGWVHEEYNNWFNFLLPNTSITSATLFIWSAPSNPAPTLDPEAFYSLYQASGFTFSGLATGAYLGSITLAAANTGIGEYIGITLNATGLSALNSHLGGEFNFGGSITTTYADPNETIDQIEAWGWTNGVPVAYLQVSVNAVPEPETYAMLLAGLGLLGFAARRRKQKEAVAA